MPKLIAPNSIIVVSGRSGSGKTSVLSTLEDFGYYPLDNLPLSIVPLAIENWSMTARFIALLWA